MKKVIDFVFVDARPEFADFFRPLLPELSRHGFSCQILSPKELDVIFNSDVDLNKAEMLSKTKVVVTTNEAAWIKYFRQSKKVLLGHSIFIRDTTPSPAVLNSSVFADFDYYFCPSVYYLQWTTQTLFDSFIFSNPDSRQAMLSVDKILIPGGYVKNNRQQDKEVNAKKMFTPNKVKQILFVPSVYSPEHSGHIFHSHGVDIITALTANDCPAKIICRPHPTDRHRDYVLRMVEMFAANENIIFDLQSTPDSSLYYEPDVLITDMSGFAFAFASATGKRPIFFVETEEALKHPRFMTLARRFGRVVSTHSELVKQVSKQLAVPDLLDNLEHDYLRRTLYEKFNNIKNMVDDLIAINSGTILSHWTRLPLC